MSKIYKNILFISFLLCSSQVSKAQLYLVKGEVQDILGTPVTRPSVLVGKEQKPALSDDYGQFKVLLNEGRHSFSVRALGYLTKRMSINVKSDTTIYVFLEQVSTQLEQVVISSDRGSDNINKPVGIAQLNTKVLKRIPAAFGETDVLRGLQMLPGVSTVGEASNGINVRGGTTDQNLILLDETPIFNPTHLFGLFSVFPSDAIATTSLYKGNVPSRFGGRASSVLDVTLANPKLDSFALEGGIGLVSSRVLANFPIVRNKLGLALSTRASFTDFLLPLISKENFENIKANFQEVAAKGLYRPNLKNSIFFTAYYSRDFFQTDLLGTIANINAEFTQNAFSTLNLNLRHFKSFNDRLSLSTSLSYVDYQPELRLPEKGIDNIVVLKSGIFYRSIRSNLDYVDNIHRAKFGFSSKWHKINPGELIPFDSPSVNSIRTNVEHGLETAVFIEDNLKLTGSLAASIGLRYSLFTALGPSDVLRYNSAFPFTEAEVVGKDIFGSGKVIKTYGGLEPRIGIRYDLSDRTSLKFAYNLMRQYIQTVTNTTTPLPTSRWKTADTYILPQISHAISTGWFHNLSDNVYEFSTEVYYRTTKNVLDYKQGANLLLQQFPETELLRGKNISYGLEMVASKKRGNWTGWFSYAFARSQNRVAEINDGNLFSSNYDRPHTFNAFLNFDHGKHHNFSFSFTYSTGRPFSSPNGTFNFQGINYPFYPSRNNDRLPDYHRLDFSWNILTTIDSAKKWKSYWTFSVYNLYGKDNPYSIYFNNNNENRVLRKFGLNIFASPIVSLAYNIRFRES